MRSCREPALGAATAIAYGPDDNLYVSVYGQGAAEGQGEVVRVRLAPPNPNRTSRRSTEKCARRSGHFHCRKSRSAKSVRKIGLPI